MAKVLESNNYSKFVLSPFNREVGRTWRLEQSLLKYGWLDEYPMAVTRLPDGKLRIDDGHNRFYSARKHGIPVKYIETKSQITQAERDGTHKNHSLQDYLHGFAQNNYEAYIAVFEYHKKTGIKLNACISMLSGSSAGSGNWRKQFKEGTYRLGDPAHANLVGDLVTHCRKHEFRCWNDTPFVNALSKIAWAEVFDPQVLKNKITAFPEQLKKHGTREEYVLMLEAIYNRYSKDLVPLA
ncbi:MAG: hypothetical protein QME78_00330, partial [Thermodesulfobacteriota bacterium]|nr:hypothetical protein [Thermodesulfobacteriota bacterium]